MALEETGVTLRAANGDVFNAQIKSAQQVLQGFLDSAGKGTSSLGGFNVISGALAITIGNILSQALQTGAAAIENIGSEAVMGAARMDTMRTAAEFLGGSVGASKGRVDALMESLQKLGIEDTTAADAVSQFSRYQLDLSKTTDLARVAQNASILTGQSVNDTYSQMIYAIENANMRALRAAGIFADVAKAERELAAQTGKKVTDLTEEEKVQATLNATLEAGTRIQGLYNKTSQDAGVILSNLPTKVQDLLDKIGEPFQKALGTGAKAISDLVDTGIKAFSEGGTLYPAITALGSNLDELGKHFIDLAGSAANSMGLMGDDVGTRIATLINNAFIWGENLINNFGSGMIEGAVAVINALAYIGEIISSMLQANSPPKLLPDLPKWGAAAMQSYLKGWQQADFTVFNDISGVIESALRSTAGTKDTGLIPKILGDRSAIAQAIESVRETGSVTEGILDRLYAKTHITDAAMREYLKTTLELAVANDKVKAAQDALNAITAKYDAILKPLQAQQQAASVAGQNMDDTRKMSQLQMILNDVNATAADKERAKLEIQQLSTGIQIRNVTQQKDIETSAAQQALDNATAQRDAILAQQEAAKALVEMHTKDNTLLKEQAALLEALAKAAKAGGGGGAAGIKVETPSDKALKAVFDDFKNRAAGLSGIKIVDPFKDIKQSINDLTTALTNMTNAWAPVTTAAKPFFDWINTNLPNLTKFLTIFVTVSAVLGAIVGIIAAVVGAILGLSNPITAIILVVALATAAWLTWGNQIKKWINDTIAGLKDWYAKSYKEINDWVMKTGDDFTGWVRDNFKRFTDWIADVIKAISGWVTDTEKSISDWSSSVGKTISDWVTNAKKAITGWISDTLRDLQNWASNAYNSAVTWATNIVDGLIAGLKSAWGRFTSYFSSLVSDLPGWIRKLLGISSPSTVFASIGASMMEGWAKGIMDKSHLPQLALQRAMGGTVGMIGGGMYAPPSVSNSVTNYWSLTMQTVQQPRSVQASFELLRLMVGG